MAYIDGDTLRKHFGAENYTAMFDDTGARDQTASDFLDNVAAVCERASRRVDAWVFDTYGAQVPFNEVSPPATVVDATLSWAMAFAYLRNPDYEIATKRYDKAAKEALEVCKLIQSAEMRMPDAPNPRPGNVGGIITAGGPNFMIASPDGTDNGNGF